MEIAVGAAVVLSLAIGRSGHTVRDRLLALPLALAVAGAVAGVIVHQAVSQTIIVANRLAVAAA